MGSPVEFIITFINIFFDVISFAILARILLSWFKGPVNHKIHQILIDLTDPILIPARKITPQIAMMDFSPIVAMIALDLIRSFIIYILTNL